MAKHLPDYHSPLLALGKKVLFWAILPVALLAVEEYVTNGVLLGLFGPDKPLTAAQIMARQLAAKNADAGRKMPTVQRAEALKERLAKPTTLKDIQDMYSLLGEKLEGNELAKVEKMTPQQMEEYKQKKINGLSEAKKGEYVRKMIAEAEKRLAANPAAATCDRPDDDLIPGMDAKLVRDGANYKIVLLNGKTVPKGSAVTGPDGQVIVRTDKDDTSEFSIKAGDVPKRGKLSVKKDPTKPEYEAYVHVLVDDARCLKPKGT